MRRNFPTIATAICAGLWLAAAGLPGSSAEAQSGGDIVCGPRCVQFLLRHYEAPDEELIELAREVQWPDFEGGASLEALARCLEARGIHTFAMRIDPGSRLSWPHPVLVHLSGEGEPLGHYVVWLPSSSNADTHVWSGLTGTRTGPWGRLAAGMSGAVLLTAPAPIDRPDAAIAGPRVSRRVRFALLLVVSAAAVASISIARRARGRRAAGFHEV
jgi:ABC-type bacteriocin/lantibiotic exporter with double-glycine peptidase domain